MRRERAAPRTQEATEGIRQLEGYLLLQRQDRTARLEAEAFADRLSWLTTAQRDEVVRLYTADRIALAHRILRAVAQRCRDLQSEYSDRYETLRARLLRAAVASGLLCLSVAIGTVAFLLSG